MKYLLLLSGENLELSKEEVLALSNSKKYRQKNNLLILESKKFDFKRLAFTHKVFKFLFSCSEKELLKKIKQINWQRHYKKSFCIRAGGLKEKEIAGIIWDKLKNPKVDLRKARTKIGFLKANNTVYCGLLLYENKEEFNKRKAHNRPGFSPVSLHPKLARCLVNLSQAKKNILDPFCGTGGILIEAGLMGIKVTGSDYDERMLIRAEKNLKFFKIKNYKLKKADARTVQIKAEAIVTDPPYGISSSLTGNIKNLMKKFLDNAYDLLPKSSILVMTTPNKLKIKSKFKTKIIDFYIHKNLTRTINIMLK